MPADLIDDMEVTDPVAFADYAEQSPPTVARSNIAVVEGYAPA